MSLRTERLSRGRTRHWFARAPTACDWRICCCVLVQAEEGGLEIIILIGCLGRLKYETSHKMGMYM